MMIIGPKTKNIKKSIIYMIAIVVLAVIIGFLVYNNLTETRLKSFQMDQMATVDVSYGRIMDDLGNAVEDLVISVNNENITNFKSTQINGQLAIELTNYLRMKAAITNNYELIRILNNEGKEIVHIENGIGATAPKKVLEDLSKWKYFLEFQNLKKGEIYVSDMDLYTLNDQVQIPIRPVIRFGGAVVNKDGIKIGTLLFNYKADTIISHVEKIKDYHNDQQMIILNKEGYWLSSPEKNREWGFMYPGRKSDTFANYYPAEWQKIRNKNEGTFVSTDGSYVFKKVYPDSITSSNNAQVGRNPYWIIVSKIPHQALADLNFRDFIYIALFGGVITSLLILLLLIMVGSREVLKEVNRDEIKKNALLEEQKNQLEEMKIIAEKANTAKSDFLSNMSHEIRTPLNAIVGFSELTLKTNLTERQHNYISKIVASSKTLLGLISDILDLSKIEADKLDLEAKSFSIEEVLESVVSAAGHKSREKGLELLVSIDEDVPMNIIGDSLRLGQIMTNLVGNAVKFTDEGEVTIKIKLLENVGDVVLLEFSIKDTGIGLAEEQIKNLFQPFVQAETSTTRKYGGTGLGLAICQKLVRLMKGNIGVESEVGKGSIFFFTAWFGVDGKERFSHYRSLFEDWNLKVLVVDDNEECIEITRNLLTGMSFDVTTSNSGEEAIALLEGAKNDKPYGLVIMDWKMPRMDGIEASECIKKQFASGRVPKIIMLTAYGSPEILVKAEQVGVESVLYKPVTPSLLLNSIMDVCGKNGIKQIDVRQNKKEDNDFSYELCGIRVLLVEDNQINQEVAREILGGEGLLVTVANNGREALDRMKKDLYDVVLMDVQMPIMDGYEATREIRKNPKFAKLPIIAMTANALQAEKEKCLKAGMNDHITKPIDTNKLFRIIEHWVKKEQSTSSERAAAIERQASGEIMPENRDLSSERLGIDIQAGLSRLGGNQKLYHNLLMKFFKYHQNAVEEIRKALDHDDLKTAETIAHTIKGAAGNLGAQDVYLASSKLSDEIRINTGQNAGPLLMDLERALKQAFVSISLLDKSVEETQNPYSDKLDLELIRPVMDQLEKLLIENDLDSVECIKVLVNLTENTIYAEKTIEMKDSIDRYNFEDAARVLNEMLTIIKEASKDD